MTDRDELVFTPAGVAAISPGLSEAIPGVQDYFARSTLEGSQPYCCCDPSRVEVDTQTQPRVSRVRSTRG
ncbi:MAG: hypothetical protein JWN70_2638 [Planctomycetaceae bacterium]|nr:hypothetical protein [Planctomycetaceae bacterium]